MNSILLGQFDGRTWDIMVLKNDGEIRQSVTGEANTLLEAFEQVKTACKDLGIETGDK